MSYTSSEFYGSYAHPTHEYSHEGNYYEGSQFGPPPKATTPDMKFPTILEQSNRFGYNALTHDGDGTNYYNVANAYGNSCDPKYYVAECPSNKFVRPFTPDLNDKPSCNIENQLISEGFEHPLNPMEEQLKKLQVHFFFSVKCVPSQKAYQEYSKALGEEKFKMLFKLMDIDSENNVKILTSLGGFATPFFYSVTTGKAMTGLYKLEDLISGLSTAPLPTPRVPKPTSMPMRENYHDHMKPHTSMAPMHDHHHMKPHTSMEPMHENYEHNRKPSPTLNPLVQKVKDLKMEVYVMPGCHYCDKIKKTLQDQKALEYVKFTPSSNVPKDMLPQIRGFPYIKSHATGKTYTGYADLPTLVNKLR